MKTKGELAALLVAVALAVSGCSGQAATQSQQGAEAAGLGAAATAVGETASPMPPAETPMALPSDTSVPQPTTGSISGTGDYGYGTNGATPTIAPAASMSGQVSVATATTSLGLILVDDRGDTLYALTTDTPGVSTCEGKCLANWPPLLTGGTPTAGAGVEAALLGTMTRSDGTTQVTYDGKPLYTFVGDNAAGDVNGQGRNGVWFAVTAMGDYVR
jgi:predicted lipoprotein with Yx(FWY)xxD motif